jgi:co-chaperonin GroES (HSP10)
MSNLSGIRPTGPTILVLPLEIEKTTSSGIIVAAGDKAKREQMAQAEGEVVAIGDMAWIDQPSKEPWCKVGDKILFAKFAGMVIEGKDGNEYRLISDLDVKAVFE